MKFFHLNTKRQLNLFLTIAAISQLVLIGGSPLPRRTGYDPNIQSPSYLSYKLTSRPVDYNDPWTYKAAQWESNDHLKEEKQEPAPAPFVNKPTENYYDDPLINDKLVIAVLKNGWENTNEFDPNSITYLKLKDGSWMPTPEELPEDDAVLRLALKGWP